MRNGGAAVTGLCYFGHSFKPATARIFRSLAFLACFSLAASGETIYDTTPNWDGINSISPFGFPDTSTFGQTFVAPPTDTLLDDFTFYLDVPGGTTLQLTAIVFDWAGSLLGGGGGQATGPALFQSSSITANGDDTFDKFTIATGGLDLTGGDSYVALFTVSGTADYDATTGTAEWGNVPLHLANDGGGGFVFYNTGGDANLINTSMWDNFTDYGDSAWTADFSAPAITTTDPSTLVLISLGIAIIVVVGMRRKHLS